MCSVSLLTQQFTSLITSYASLNYRDVSEESEWLQSPALTTVFILRIRRNCVIGDLLDVQTTESFNKLQLLLHHH